MPTLTDMLGTNPKRDQVITDACEVLDAEVSDKGGIAGLAIKAAYGVVKGVRPGFVREAIDTMLDDFLGALDPLYQEAVASKTSAGGLLRANPGRVADALLGITDRRAAHAERAVVKSAYEKLRPTAKKHVEAAVPRLAKLLDKHAPH